jgi:hypothetical protein
MTMGDRSFLCFVGGVLAGALVLGGAGCGRQLVGVAKPADLLAWEPQATDPTARITAVSSTADWIYVGFSDGEMFSRPNADGASWASYATGEAGGCGAPIPPDTVTAFAISVAGLPADEQQTFVAFAGPPGSSKIWHAPPDRPCWATSLLDEDVYGLSASPFSGLDVVAVSPADLRATNKDDFTTFSDWTAGVFPIDFDGTVQALASGASPSGATRAWLGDDAGNVYYSDDVDSATASASASITWTPLPNPGFPRRPVVAIATRPDHPQTIWVTFAGLYGDSLWSSTDNGATWHNPRGGELGSVFQTAGPDGAAEADAQAPVGSSKASFGVVSPVPGLPAAYVTALVPDWKGVPVATAFWTLEGTGDWWRQ